MAKIFERILIRIISLLIDTAAAWAICKFWVDWSEPIAFINFFWGGVMLGLLVGQVKLNWVMYEPPKFE